MRIIHDHLRHNMETLATLIQRAATAGLKSLVTELRHLEREIDPDGLKYPRYKQSDDTTAILLRLEA